MNMVTIRPNLHEMNLVPFTNLQANLLDFRINFLSKFRVSAFGYTDQMI